MRSSGFQNKCGAHAHLKRRQFVTQKFRQLSKIRFERNAHDLDSKSKKRTNKAKDSKTRRGAQAGRSRKKGRGSPNGASTRFESGRRQRDGRKGGPARERAVRSVFEIDRGRRRSKRENRGRLRRKSTIENASRRPTIARGTSNEAKRSPNHREKYDFPKGAPTKSERGTSSRIVRRVARARRFRSATRRGGGVGGRSRHVTRAQDGRFAISAADVYTS